jgi:uncharacterized SAM-binding protein YcdF (DUF218 family)
MDSAFFILSKLVGFGLQIETWLAIGLTSSVVAGRWGLSRSARWIGSSTLLVLLLITILPVGELLLRPLEAEFPPREAPEQIDGIVVLGGVEDPRTTEYWDQPQVNQAAERLTAAAALALKHPDSRLVFSGGSGQLRDWGERHLDLPSIAVDIFTSLGISPHRITWEDQSRNTVENARFSLAVAAPAPGETWLLVTSAFHMGRSVASFEAAGWLNITPYPVDFRTGDFRTGIGWDLAGKLGTLNTALKEWVGRAAYALTGR